MRGEAELPLRRSSRHTGAARGRAGPGGGRAAGWGGAGRGGGGQRENVEVGTRAGTRSRAMGREVEAPERFVPRLGL